MNAAGCPGCGLSWLHLREAADEYETCPHCERVVSSRRLRLRGIGWYQRMWAALHARFWGEVAAIA